MKPLNNVSMMACDLIERALERDGFTARITFGSSLQWVRSGYAVSDHKELETIVPVSDQGFLLGSTIGFIIQNQALLTDGKHCIGGWFHEGNLYLDVVRVVKSGHQANRIAKENDQIAYYCLDTLEELATH